MRISEISDADLSLWIANKLEPKPNDWSEHLYFSPKNAWLCHNPQSNVRVGQYEWVARDMVNDTEMTVMLMDSLMRDERRDCYLSFERVGQNAQQYEFEIGVTEFGFHQGQRGVVIHGKQFGRLIAEAFALAQGWPDSQEKTS